MEIVMVPITNRLLKFSVPFIDPLDLPRDFQLHHSSLILIAQLYFYYLQT